MSALVAASLSLMGCGQAVQTDQAKLDVLPPLETGEGSSATGGADDGGDGGEPPDPNDPPNKAPEPPIPTTTTPVVVPPESDPDTETTCSGANSQDLCGVSSLRSFTINGETSSVSGVLNYAWSAPRISEPPDSGDTYTQVAVEVYHWQHRQIGSSEIETGTTATTAGDPISVRFTDLDAGAGYEFTVWAEFADAVMGPPATARGTASTGSTGVTPR